MLALASTSFCTAGATAKIKSAVGFSACKISALCSRCHESGAGCPLSMLSSAASPAAARVVRFNETGESSFSKNEFCNKGCN